MTPPRRRARHRSPSVSPTLSAIVLGGVLLFSVLSGAPAVVRAQPGDDAERMLIVGLLSEPGTLNPLVTTSSEARDIIDRFYLRLLEERGDFLHFGPQLAGDWQFSDDGLSITFFLRDDMRWHDGEPVTARDVRFTWELQTDTLVAWPGAGIKENIVDVEVVDDYTVTFHFSQRYPYQLMDANDGVILPRHVLAEVPRAQVADHAIGREPVGNGPYRFSRWVSGRYIELVANENWPDSQPVVTTVVYRFVPDMVTLVTQLRKGEIDALESVPPDRADELEGSPSIKLYTYPSRRMNYIAWNLENELFENREVREALTMAINREEIIQTVWGGYARECKSPVHPILWAYDDAIRAIPFEPGQAKGKLNLRGWRDRDGDGVLENGDGMKLEFDLLVNNNQVRIDVVTLVQAYLNRIGVRANVQVLEFNTYIERVLSGNYDAAFIGWKTATKVDVKSLWHSDAVPPNGYNVAFYRNPKVDRWIDEARVELDAAKAQDLWYKVQEQIYRDQPFTFLAVPLEVNALHRRFCNVRPNAISFFANLRAWRIAPDCSAPPASGSPAR